MMHAKRNGLRSFAAITTNTAAIPSRISGNTIDWSACSFFDPETTSRETRPNRVTPVTNEEKMILSATRLLVGPSPRLRFSHGQPGSSPMAGHPRAAMAPPRRSGCS